MDAYDAALERAVWIAQQMQKSPDRAVMRKITTMSYGHSDYVDSLKSLGIHVDAWEYIAKQSVDPKLVFAHPSILMEYPQASLHYRGMAALPYKRVKHVASAVNDWEREDYAGQPNKAACERVAVLYNTTISTIILNSDGWTEENGYRNILATVGTTKDGVWRNMVGSKGEKGVKKQVVKWLKAETRIPLETIKEGQEYILGSGTKTVRMRFSSEPDISFERKVDDSWVVVSTIEIKSGTDPAGALERLGAVQKSFVETPVQSQNFLVLGVETKEMSKRLKELNVKSFDIHAILDGGGKEYFINEVFHHALRLTDEVPSPTSQPPPIT